MMREILAVSAIALGIAGIVAAMARGPSGPSGRAATPSRAEERGGSGAVRVVLTAAGLAFLTLGIGVVVATDTGPMAALSLPAPTLSRGRGPVPSPSPRDTTPVGAYRRSADASCARVGVLLRDPVDASRAGIEAALRASAASFEDLADALDGVQAPPSLLNRHHRLVTAVRRTGRIVADAAAELRVGPTGAYAQQLEQLGRAVADLDRQARGLQLPHCRPS